MGTSAMTKQVLVTGATGYIGQQLLEVLVSNPEVKVLYSYRNQALEDSRAIGMRLDLNDEKSFEAYTADFAAVEYLIHAAATVEDHATDIQSDVQNHLLGDIRMVTNLISHLPNLKQVIYVSSCSAELADTSSSLYGLGKLVTEKLLIYLAKQNQFTATILRFPQVYGAGEPHGIFITRFIESLKNKKAIQLVNDGAVFKDLLYVKDAVGSIIKALENPKEGTFTITESGPHTVKEVLDYLIKTMNIDTPHIENRIVSDEEVKKNSFHFSSSASELDYNIEYTLENGLTEMTEIQKGKHVS